MQPIVMDDPRITLEEYYDRGRAAAADMDRGRYTIGDDALEIKSLYGERTLKGYSKEINVRLASVHGYRRVCKFYQFSTRVQFLEEHPTICYSHLREAMRLKDVDTAYAFLEEVNDNALTVEAASIELLKRLGKPVPPMRESWDVYPYRVDDGDELFFHPDNMHKIVQFMKQHTNATFTLTAQYAALPQAMTT